MTVCLCGFFQTNLILQHIINIFLSMVKNNYLVAQVNTLNVDYEKRKKVNSKVCTFYEIKIPLSFN